ncbi:MAG: UDP-N-acetyl glucosamine 2-epimerase [Anaerolineae bacterium]
MQRILHVVGARPNFMKVAPIMAEMARYPDEFHQILVHTGQHYDDNMSQVFFEELELPRPAINLGVGSGSHAWQIAQVMLHFEPVVLDYKPDLVLVVGDVNSTLACALTCAKLGIRVGHVEAGLRSFDRTMPEEYNRLLTDHIADLLFTPSRDADENLRREGIPEERIHFVGNVMIDTLVRLLPKALDRWIRIVDDGRLRVLEPLGYLDFLALMRHAALVITDSGGIQEETTFLGVPCLTIRPNAERPITMTEGTNRLVPSQRQPLVEAAREALDGGGQWRCPEPFGELRTGCVEGSATGPPKLWDGRAADRIVDVIRHAWPAVAYDSESEG